MAIRLQELEDASTRVYRSRMVKSMNEAKVHGVQTAFLSHSHEDKIYVEGLRVFLEEQGWHVYLDWQDLSLPTSPDGSTAAGIKSKIQELSWFLFLATPNSTSSRWCPWEIGYADGVKKSDQIIVIPTVDKSGKYHGNEYLQLYRHIYRTTSGQYAIFRPHEQSGTLLRFL